MNIQNRVLNIYALILRRLRRWGISVIIFLVYLSAFLMYRSFSSTYFTISGIRTIHVLAGGAFILTLLILGYNQVVEKMSLRDLHQPKIKAFNPERKPIKPELLINQLFFGIGGLTSLNGFLSMGVRTHLFPGFIKYQPGIDFIHHSLGWIFLSIVLIKLYRGIINRVRGLHRYLREA